MIEQRFGESQPFAVGVEEEVMILDAETFLPIPAVNTLVSEAEKLDLPGRLTTELHASVVELKTNPCASAADALDALRQLRRAGAEIAARHGLRLAAAGTHPISRPEELEIADEPRYREFVEYAGVSARRQGVSGLHVHVAMPDADSCFQALEGTLPWLPLILAVSANSPFLAGVATGLASNRAEVLAQLPRSGPPPAFRSYAEWESFVERFPLATDYTNFWWDIRPHPRFGTLEIRMPDQPTRVERSGGLAALLQAVAVSVLRLAPRPHDPGERGVYQQNRWAALRHGMRAELIHPDGRSVASAERLTDELMELIEPASQELGSTALLQALDRAQGEGERQLAVARDQGLVALCRDLADRFAPAL
ncbi:MAG: YbdK family carboxylate-amine ligase [Actinobacteria bacterium]|nr:YbdK family carboxylate-amine ligase [Actinomycetota bacterium]